MAEADRPGARSAAAKGAATALLLERTLKAAKVAPADNEPAAFELRRELFLFWRNVRFTCGRSAAQFEPNQVGRGDP